MFVFLCIHTHIKACFNKKSILSQTTNKTEIPIKCLSAFEKLHWQVASHRKIDPKQCMVLYMRKRLSAWLKTWGFSLQLKPVQIYLSNKQLY